METLNPRLDVVFKLLFAAEQNHELLVALLNAVLRPETPFISVEVINPGIEKDALDQRGVVLDMLVVRGDGTRSNIEMQVQDYEVTQQHILYHWACTYGVVRGDESDAFNPCLVISFLSCPLLPGERFHSIFRLSNARNDTLLSEDFELHTIELTKLDGMVDAEDEGLRVWAQFLKATTDEERRLIAEKDPMIEKANKALKDLSQNPNARALAQWREDQLRS